MELEAELVLSMPLDVDIALFEVLLALVETFDELFIIKSSTLVLMKGSMAL